MDTKGGTYIFHSGEFAQELIMALPAAYGDWLSGRLVATRGCGAMQPFYYFSPNHTDDLHCSRVFDRAGMRQLGWDFHSVKIPARELWRPPPLRARYAKGRIQTPTGRELNASMPVVLLANKHNTEWGHASVNFFSIAILDTLLSVLRAQGLQVVYNRPQQFIDNSEALDFPDAAWLERNFDDVFSLDEFARGTPELSFNEVQLNVFSRVDYAISVQGGPATFCGYFAREGVYSVRFNCRVKHSPLARFGLAAAVLVLHKEGREANSGEHQAVYERFDNAIYIMVTDDAQLVQLVKQKAPLWGQVGA